MVDGVRRGLHELGHHLHIVAGVLDPLFYILLVKWPGEQKPGVVIQKPRLDGIVDRVVLHDLSGLLIEIIRPECPSGPWGRRPGSDPIFLWNRPPCRCGGSRRKTRDKSLRSFSFFLTKGTKVSTGMVSRFSRMSKSTFILSSALLNKSASTFKSGSRESLSSFRQYVRLFFHNKGFGPGSATHKRPFPSFHALVEEALHENSPALRIKRWLLI